MKNVIELYRSDNLPVLQNRVFDSYVDAIHCQTGDVVLVQDSESGLIYNQAFDPNLICYDEAYDNEQSHSSVFQTHLDDVTDIIQTHFQQESSIEIGCGKGYFLERLNQLGFNIKGCDPSYTGNNPNIVKENFHSELGLCAPNIILRHVLEHIPTPVDFLHSIKDANGGQGTIYIEVPCFNWICGQRAFFDIFYEHVNYFLLDDFKRIFRTVYESGYMFGGQYLYVLADLASLCEGYDYHFTPYPFPQDFLEPLYQCQKIFQPTSAIWGSASKGVLFALMMKRLGCEFQCAIDINPNKLGKYLPCTGLQIQSPEQALQQLANGTDIYVMNSNYLEEIKQTSNNQFNYITVDHGSI